MSRLTEALGGHDVVGDDQVLVEPELVLLLDVDVGEGHPVLLLDVLELALQIT